MRYFKAITIIGYICNYSLATADQQAILIFLDDTETKSEAISEYFITVLAQKTGPLIVSRHVAENMLLDYKPPAYTSVAKLSDAQLEARLERDMSGTEGEKATRIEKDIVIYASQFDPKQWLIKKIGDHLLLFIPHEYLQRQAILPADTAYFPLSSITKTELKLGIKVNHMQPFLAQDFKKNTELQEYSDYFYTALYDENAKSSSIFCVNAEYATSTYFPPVWTIYMAGHGTTQKKAAALSIDVFKAVLDFYQTKIRTKLLMYTSCYAAGLTNETIYKDAQSAIYKTYPFAIITQAITEASVTAFKPKITMGRRGMPTLSVKQNFSEFIRLATATDALNYQAVANTIMPLIPAHEFAQRIWANVPQIKLPGLGWFSVLASQQDIVSIGSIMAKTISPKKSINITGFFNADPRALLLYAPIIPFHLVIDGKNMKAIISMIPGDIIHRIRKISSAYYKINQIVDWFMKISHLDTRKIFFIESLNNVDNVIIYNDKIVGKPTIGVPDQYVSYAFYYANNGLLAQKPGEQPKPATQEQATMYRSVLNRIQGKVTQLGSFAFSNLQDVEFPPFEGATIISAIEAVPGISISNIIAQLQNASNTDSMVWIDKITVAYEDDFFDLPVQEGAVTTVSDIWIDRNQQVFITHDGLHYQGKKKLDYDYRPEAKLELSQPYHYKESSSVSPAAIKEIERVHERKKIKGPEPFLR